MRVLFLYYHFPQAEPLLRIREMLEANGILLDARQVNAGWDAPTKKPNHVIPSIAEYMHGDFDLLLIQHQIMQEDALFCRRPVLVMERSDGPQLEARHWLPHVAGVIKNYALRPRSMNNQHFGRLSARMLRDAGVVAPNSIVIDGTPAQLTEDELAKIVVGYGFCSYPRFELARAQFVDLVANRRYHAQLRCQHGYRDTEIGIARVKAFDRMRVLSENNPHLFRRGAEVPYDEYLREMTVCKCVVSPWGWGESCHRDYEAWLLGAVVIKPNSDHVEAWPDLYHADVNYVPCAIDYSDLGEVIDRVVNDYDAYLPMRTRAREAVLAGMEPEALMFRMKEIFRRFA